MPQMTVWQGITDPESKTVAGISWDGGCGNTACRSGYSIVAASFPWPSLQEVSARINRIR